MLVDEVDEDGRVPRARLPRNVKDSRAEYER
jgi:hypothetical protein